MKKVMVLAMIFASVFSISISAQQKDSCPPCPALIEPTHAVRPTSLPEQQKKVIHVITRPANYSSSISGSFNTTTNNYYGKMPGERCYTCDNYGCGGYYYDHRPLYYAGTGYGGWAIFWCLLALGLLILLVYLLASKYRTNNPYPTDSRVAHTYSFPAAKSEKQSEIKEYPKPVEPALDLSSMTDQLKESGATVDIKADGSITVSFPKPDK